MSLEANYDFHLPPEMVKKYISNRRVDIHVCQTALENNDFEKIAELAHQMKGNGASFGFAKITEMSGDLETAAKKEDSYSIKTHLQKLNSFLESNLIA
jgi:HPt (histidine-containing phosphotransfer) domain-containing protein